MVRILLDGAHTCGAALVDKCHILTAAHCVGGRDISSYKVVLADHSFQRSDKWEVTINRCYLLMFTMLLSFRKH